MRPLFVDADRDVERLRVQMHQVLNGVPRSVAAELGAEYRAWASTSSMKRRRR
jgi:hypothetical protein